MGNETETTSLLTTSIVRLKTIGGRERRLHCFDIPDPLFTELCDRIINHKGESIKAAGEWLATQMPNAPSVRSVQRFAKVLYKAAYEAACARGAHCSQEFAKAEGATGGEE